MLPTLSDQFICISWPFSWLPQNESVWALTLLLDRPIAVASSDPPKEYSPSINLKLLNEIEKWHWHSVLFWIVRIPLILQCSGIWSGALQIAAHHGEWLTSREEWGITAHWFFRYRSWTCQQITARFTTTLWSERICPCTYPKVIITAKHFVSKRETYSLLNQSYRWIRCAM